MGQSMIHRCVFYYVFEVKSDGAFMVCCCVVSYQHSKVRLYSGFVIIYTNFVNLDED